MPIWWRWRPSWARSAETSGPEHRYRWTKPGFRALLVDWVTVGLIVPNGAVRVETVAGIACPSPCIIVVPISTAGPNRATIANVDIFTPATPTAIGFDTSRLAEPVSGLSCVSGVGGAVVRSVPSTRAMPRVLLPTRARSEEEEQTEAGDGPMNLHAHSLPPVDGLDSGAPGIRIPYGDGHHLHGRAPRAVLDRLRAVDIASVAISSITLAALERQGTPIGSLDLLIAAHALSLDLTVVTNNEREFRRVSGLKVENWA